ncbi:MAG: A24 family peptidase [Thermoplasmatota archaeon]
MLEALGAGVAVVGTAAAAYVDLKTREIPNRLTLSMMAAGLAVSALRVYTGCLWFMVAVPVALAWALSWALWRAGLFGGGDAKLLMGITALFPLFPDGTAFAPSFFLVLALASLAHFFLVGAVTLASQGHLLRLAGFALLPTGVGAAAYLLARLWLAFPALVALLAGALTADLLAPCVPHTRRMRISESLARALLAEYIGVRDGQVIRMPVSPSLLRSLVAPPRAGFDRVLASPNHGGLSRDTIRTLSEWVDYIDIFPGYPLAPVILVSLLVSLGVGNVFPWAA